MTCSNSCMTKKGWDNMSEISLRQTQVHEINSITGVHVKMLRALATSDSMRRYNTGQPRNGTTGDFPCQTLLAKTNYKVTLAQHRLVLSRKNTPDYHFNAITFLYPIGLLASLLGVYSVVRTFFSSKRWKRR